MRLILTPKQTEDKKTKMKQAKVLTKEEKMVSVKEINPQETTRASAFELWMNAPNPMVTFFKTYDVMPLIRKSRESGMKFNMLLDWCIGKAASTVAAS